MLPQKLLSSKAMSSSSSSVSMVTEKMKARAEVCHGDELCRQKFMLLLAEIGLPLGLLTVEEGIEECGYVKEIGFVWLKHKQKKEHKFENSNVVVWFDTEVTAYFERNKIKNLTGVKAKEFLVWVSLCEIYVNGGSGGGNSLITFKTPVGLSKSFPISVFQIDQDHHHHHDDWILNNKEEIKDRRRAICAVQV